MFENVPNQFLSFGKQVAENTFKAQLLALESFERVADLQMKTLENRMNATMAFLGEAAEVRDFDAARAFWPKGVNLFRESAEQFVGTTQEVLGQSMKASEALGQLVRTQVEAVNEGVARNANKAAKAAAAK
jgi:translation elongation factor EF-Ts